jgi:hypothetical protein
MSISTKPGGDLYLLELPDLGRKVIRKTFNKDSCGEKYQLISMGAKWRV